MAPDASRKLGCVYARSSDKPSCGIEFGYGLQKTKINAVFDDNYHARTQHSHG